MPFDIDDFAREAAYNDTHSFAILVAQKHRRASAYFQ